MQVGRLKYEKPVFYNKKVKIGPWVEENRHYCKQCLEQPASYSIDFSEKPYSARDVRYLWNNKFFAEGVHPRIIRDHESPKYLENYSTLYDLSYNHFPRCLKGPIQKFFHIGSQSYKPEIDYTLNYGNITNYGTLDYKKFKWCKDGSKVTPSTHHDSTFLVPPENYLKFKRFACPRVNSSKLLKINKELHNLQLRGSTNFMVAEPIDMVTVPAEPRCNPITWECPNSLKEQFHRCREVEDGLLSPPRTHSNPKPIPFSCITGK